MIASELDPLIVTAPSIRCGTTLLQRLICSAPNGLLYGEPVANDLFNALQLNSAQVAMYEQYRGQVGESLAAFREGKSDDWMIDLMPDLDGYLRAFADGHLAPIAYCRDFARNAGRPVWGMKYPGWGAGPLNLIRNSLPRAKVIFIHRDIVPVLRSAKARGSVRRLAGVKAFCAQWASNMKAVAQLRESPNALVIDYDDLVRDAELVLQRIEAFAGLEPIDRAVLAQRVNTFGGVIPPAELKDEEMAAAEEARRTATPSPPPPRTA